MILLFRAVILHIFPISSENLLAIAKRQYQKHLALSPYRGTIFDRRKNPFAISIRQPSLFINPRIFSPTRMQIKKISKKLGLSSKKIKLIMQKNNYFAWLKRKVKPEDAKDIMGLSIKGLYQVLEPARFYPSSFTAAHLIGYVGIDNRGLMGVENRFDDDLRGEESKISKGQDARGKTIFLQTDFVAPKKTGHNLHLTIDRAIQEIAEKALNDGVKRANAKKGFAIVSDPHTGRILAIANYPGFDPNMTERIVLEHTRNSALTDIFEPGSVIKPFVIAEAIVQGVTSLEESHECGNGRYSGDNWTIRDTHPYEYLTTQEVIIHSSNICTYKIAQRLGPEGLYKALKKFGFSSRTNIIGFPSQGTGHIMDFKSWKPIRFANISFGQGFVTTGLEIVQAYGAIANGGNLMKPYVVDHIATSDELVISSNSSRVVRKVLDPKLAKVMRSVLRLVVLKGTGKRARMRDYSAAGKTGSTQKVDPKLRAYSQTKTLATFVGFAPVDDPHLVIYIAIDEPRNKPYYGGTWAAPVFKEIASNSLRYLNVAPDKKEYSNPDNLISRGLLDDKDVL